jgi:hypothetical protein
VGVSRVDVCIYVQLKDYVKATRILHDQGDHIDQTTSKVRIRYSGCEPANIFPVPWSASYLQPQLVLYLTNFIMLAKYPSQAVMVCRSGQLMLQTRVAVSSFSCHSQLFYYSSRHLDWCAKQVISFYYTTEGFLCSPCIGTATSVCAKD